MSKAITFCAVFTVVFFIVFFATTNSAKADYSICKFHNSWEFADVIKTAKENNCNQIYWKGNYYKGYSSHSLSIFRITDGNGNDITHLYHCRMVVNRMLCTAKPVPVYFPRIPTPLSKPVVEPHREPTATPTEIVPTQTPLPTEIIIPTNTPTKVIVPTNTPTMVPTNEPEPTSSPVPVIPTATLQPTNTIVPTSTNTPTPTKTLVPTPTMTSTPTVVIVPTNTPIPTVLPTKTSTPLPTPTMTSTPTPTMVPYYPPRPTPTPHISTHLRNGVTMCHYYDRNGNLIAVRPVIKLPNGQWGGCPDLN